MQIKQRKFFNLRAILGDIPSTAKNVERLREAIIVDQTSIYGKRTHQQYNITTRKHALKYLKNSRACNVL